MMQFNSEIFRDWERAKEFIDPSNRYIQSYPELLSATQCLVGNFREASIPMVAHLVYGWMPKILSYNRDINQDNSIFESVYAENLNDALAVVDSIEYPPTNNAWVGMSKTLHFLNPKLFPIWDSKVARVLGVSASKMSSRKIYRDYMVFIFSIIEQPFVERIQAEFVRRVGYEISKVRAAEFVLFVIGED